MKWYGLLIATHHPAKQVARNACAVQLLVHMYALCLPLRAPCGLVFHFAKLLVLSTSQLLATCTMRQQHLQNTAQLRTAPELPKKQH